MKIGKNYKAHSRTKVNSIMMKNISMICLVCIIASCSASLEKIALVKSPNGKGEAVIVRRGVEGVPSPPPEPSRTVASWSKLTVSRDGKVIYNSGFENLGGNQGSLHLAYSFDLLWTADSSLLAYRKLNTVRVIAKNGKVSSFDIVTDNALVSSFKWINSKELLIISKGVSDPLDLYGPYVYYHGYLTKSTYVKVSRVNVDTGKVEQRFKQEVKHPTFLFNSIGFVIHEISPYSSRVAFSDGVNINMYDDAKGKIIAKVPVEGSIEGIWWVDNNTVVLGLNLLGGKARRKFVVFDVAAKNITDKTNILSPLWIDSISGDYSYGNDKWFHSALKKL